MSEEIKNVEGEIPAAEPAAGGESRGPRREGGRREGGGPRGDRGDRGPGGPGGRGGPRRRFPRRKICYFTQTKAEYVDYKDVDILRRFVTDKGKIVPRRVTGTSAHFQRLLCTAIKRARYMALLPYSGAHK